MQLLHYSILLNLIPNVSSLAVTPPRLNSLFFFGLFPQQTKKKQRIKMIRGNKKKIKIERRIKWEKRNKMSLQMCQALRDYPNYHHA